MHKFVWGAVLLVIPYTLFWLNFFQVFPFARPKTITTTYQQSQPTQPFQKQQEVLAENISLPSNYLIALTPRKQVFNLSCEFAAAAAIIYEQTLDSFFLPGNEEAAEKRLMEAVGVSQNPNIGIRMGIDGADNLFKNLMQRFGGIDYYGVHAPPFIALFKEYGLRATPLDKNDPLSSIRQAIAESKLVMAWIKIGFGEPVDVALIYGQTTIVKGEHTVVVHGYDQDGVWVMDPGIGQSRHLRFQDLIKAMEPFVMPLLAVSAASEISPLELYEPTLGIDKTTGLDRKNLLVVIENGSGKFGKGSQLVNILRDFGYTVIKLAKADKSDYEDLTVKMKKEVWDYRGLLERDLQLASYVIATISADLLETESVDAVVIVGE